jgi:hypothetical protein
MKRKLLLVAVPLVSFTLFSFVFKVRAEPGLRSYFDKLISQSNSSLIEEGRETFRYATFGDEAWWGGQLQLHKAIEGSKFGGVGPGLSPAEALAAGLKVEFRGRSDRSLQYRRKSEVGWNPVRSVPLQR